MISRLLSSLPSLSLTYILFSLPNIYLSQPLARPHFLERSRACVRARTLSLSLYLCRVSWCAGGIRNRFRVLMCSLAPCRTVSSSTPVLYTHTQRERERERDRHTHTNTNINTNTHTHTQTHTHTHRVMYMYMTYIVRKARTKMS